MIDRIFEAFKKNERAPTGRAVTWLHDSLNQLQANLFTECLVTNP